MRGPGPRTAHPLSVRQPRGPARSLGSPRLSEQATQGPKAEVASAPSWGQSGPVSCAEQGRPGEGLASAARGPSSPGHGLPPWPSAMTLEDTKVSPPTCDQQLPGGQHAGSPKRKAGRCPSPEMRTQGGTAGWSGRHPNVLRQGWVGCSWPPTKGGACPNPRCLLSASWPPSPGRLDSELWSHRQASGHASQLRAPGGSLILPLKPPRSPSLGATARPCSGSTDWANSGLCAHPPRTLSSE